MDPEGPSDGAPPKTRLRDLPDEVLQLVAYSGWLSAADVAAFSSTSWRFKNALLGDDFDRDQYYALKWGAFYCVENGRPRAAEIAMRRGYGKPIVDVDGVAMTASRYGYAGVMKLLLANFPVKITCGSCGKIDWALEHGHTETAALLLDAFFADPEARPGYNVFVPAVRNGHTETVAFLLTCARVDPAKNNNHAIFLASEKGRADIVALLLADDRVDPAADKNRAVRVAAARGHTKTVIVLLADPRVDPSDNDNWALRMARKNGHHDIVAILRNYFRVRGAAGPRLR